MYRKPGSPGVLKGVLSGPYAGPKRVIDAQKLPRPARQRLADVLTGRADLTPILHERPAGLSSRFRASWGALVATIALATLTAIGFADPRAAWAYQPQPLVLGYVGAMMLLAFSLLSLHRRRALASGGALVPGRYLLPLDVVEITREGKDGEQLVVVTPLGNGRDARVRASERRSELVLVFDGGSEIAFGLRSESEGEHALRRLEHAQTLLEELTYARDLEKSLANDAFFDIRVDDSWESLAPSGAASRKARNRRAFLHGTAATSGALVVASVLGWAAFAGRNWASDRALYLRALRLGTSDSLEEYLVRATAHRVDAEDLRDRLAAQRVELADRARETHARQRTGFEQVPRSEWELTPEELAARRGTSEACIASLRARSSTTHPEVEPILEALIIRARKSGNPIIPVRVDGRSGSRPLGTPEIDLKSAASRMVWAFERVLSELCPAAVVKLVVRPVDRTALGASSIEPGLDVRIDLTWPMTPTWTHDAQKIFAPTFVFDVALRGIALTDVASFRLTLSPPDTEPTAVRTRSLFVVAPDAATPQYALLNARAFDRLYDEVFGLVFRGDPRVPLREEDPSGP
jgi:hypothetical protein